MESVSNNNGITSQNIIKLESAIAKKAHNLGAGIKELHEGVKELHEGVKELHEGVKEFRVEINKKLDHLIWLIKNR